MAVLIKNCVDCDFIFDDIDIMFRTSSGEPLCLECTEKRIQKLKEGA
jgi:hypothetical protein